MDDLKFKEETRDPSVNLHRDKLHAERLKQVIQYNTTQHIFNETTPPIHDQDKSHWLSVESFESLTQTMSNKCHVWGFIFILFLQCSSVYAATARSVWQPRRAQPPKCSAVLFHCQAIITAIRLEKLVYLNLGITLRHQGEEDVLLCACTHRTWH